MSESDNVICELSKKFTTGQSTFIVNNGGVGANASWNRYITMNFAVKVSPPACFKTNSNEYEICHFFLASIVSIVLWHLTIANRRQISKATTTNALNNFFSFNSSRMLYEKRKRISPSYSFSFYYNFLEKILTCQWCGD